MLMSAADYRESLRRLHPVVYVDGRRVESVADEPALAPGVNAIGVSYDFALRESTQALMRAEVPDFDGPISRSVFSSNSGSSCPTRTNSTLRTLLAGNTSKYWIPSGASPQSPHGGSGTSFGSAFAFNAFR